MATLTIPLPTTLEPLLVQTTQLDGVSFTLTFDWNERIDRWAVSIENADGTPVISGALLAIGADILRTVPDTLAHVPKGTLYLAGENDPTLETIGDTSLIYIEAE